MLEEQKSGWGGQDNLASKTYLPGLNKKIQHLFECDGQPCGPGIHLVGKKQNF